MLFKEIRAVQNEKQDTYQNNMQSSVTVTAG
jgi:hypothetical protein